MPSYTQQLNAHLAAYKTTRLGVHDRGTFVYRGRTLLYDHILPQEHRWLNILEPFRPHIQRYLAERPEIKLHRYFHHLNSSQAFALNLFFPYFQGGGSPQLLAAMGATGELSSWQPESIVEATEGTNVDVTWLAGGTRTYCEVKFSEQEFGSARNDQAHRDKLEKIYKPVLVDACAPELLQPERFFKNYQLFRNVWLVARESTSVLIFLAPRANTAIWRQLTTFLGLLAPALASRVRAAAVEDVITSLTRAEPLPTELVGYAELLREKYLPSAFAQPLARTQHQPRS